MTVQGLILIAMGIGFVAYGYRRARTFWGLYQDVAARQSNVERYERWRGGARGESSSPKALGDLRRRAAIYGLVVLFGFGFIFQGFTLR